MDPGLFKLYQITNLIEALNCLLTFLQGFFFNLSCDQKCLIIQVQKKNTKGFSHHEPQNLIPFQLKFEKKLLTNKGMGNPDHN